MIFALPALTFFLLLILEKILPTIQQEHQHNFWDQFLNCVGLLMQGCIVPALGYWLSVSIFPLAFREYKGILEIGWLNCFLLNLIFIDFLYYWQHRAFHSFTFLWNLHYCHHASSRVDIWTTSRNSILINFLFVYCLINPPLAFFCDSPEGFYMGAMVTASLDVFRHTRLNLNKLFPRWFLQLISHIIVMPCQHHNHHRLSKESVNLGANFIVWDILFGTAQIDTDYPLAYGVVKAQHPLKQLLHPLLKK